MTIQTTRRVFLKSAGAGAAVLMVGFDSKGSLAAGDAGAQLNPFVKIFPDGSVSIVIKHFETGQGTSTGLSTLVAEELDADWDSLRFEFAPADSARYANLFFGGQGTGGSTAIANSFLQHRQAGAAARDVLARAAAETWGVPLQSVTVENGVLTSGNKSAHFGEMAATAATLAPTAEPRLKSPDRFRLIGNAAVGRKDSGQKTDGTAVFAMDVKLPGMVYAVILRAPKFGGRSTAFDASGAKEVAGFLDAKPLPNKAGIAVYAKSTWSAIRARDAISVDWDFSDAEIRGTPELIAYHLNLLDRPTYQVRPGGDFSATSTAIEAAEKVVEAEFVFPNLAHAPMEPLNCVIEPTASGVLIHDGCQFPAIAQPVVAAILGLKPEQVEVNTVFAGGSFGRRATPSADYQSEAAMAFDLLGRKTPVKLVWTREDDLAGGYYRPMAAHRARIGIGADGKIVGWDHRIAVKSILKGTSFEDTLIHDGVDKVSIEGVGDTHYAIPAMAVGLSDAQSAVPVLWWRSVGHTHNAYAMEMLIDMAAEAAGVDPVALRLDLLADGDKDQQRLAGVLNLAAERSGWGRPIGAGRGRGIAVHKSFGTYVAEVAEVSVNDAGVVKIERITCAVDCGVAVNPDIIKAQMEGGIGYGLGAIMRNQITMTEGVVDQANFPDYEPLRMADMPKIEVHIMASSEPPSGVGEPGTPPAGPALANAIHGATGKRITRLPMSEAGIEFA
jgi:isoquinoline 1-oxidoreductase beta subunit